MLIDIVNAGWAPVYISNLTEDIPGYIEAPANAVAYARRTGSARLTNRCADGIGGTFIRRWRGTPVRQ
jgi:hypothetical protein